MLLECGTECLQLAEDWSMQKILSDPNWKEKVQPSFKVLICSWFPVSCRFHEILMSITNMKIGIDQTKLTPVDIVYNVSIVALHTDTLSIRL